MRRHIGIAGLRAAVGSEWLHSRGVLGGDRAKRRLTGGRSSPRTDGRNNATTAETPPGTGIRKRALGSTRRMRVKLMMRKWLPASPPMPRAPKIPIGRDLMGSPRLGGSSDSGISGDGVVRGGRAIRPIASPRDRPPVCQSTATFSARSPRIQTGPLWTGRPVFRDLR